MAYGYESTRNQGNSRTRAPQGRVTSTRARAAAVPRTATGARIAGRNEIDTRLANQRGVMGAWRAGVLDGNGSGGIASTQWDRNIPGGSGLNDLFQTTPPYGNNGGGGSGRGGGGGGGSAGPSAAQVQAYKDLLASMNGDAFNAEFDRQDAANRKLYDPALVDARWNQAGAGVTGAVGAGNDRLAGILSELQSRALQARTGVNQAYQAGDSRLQEIQGRFQGANQATQGDLNGVLGAFGAGQVQGGPEAAAMQRLFAQGQITNNGGRTVADAAQAGLPGAYAGLGADVSQGMTRDSTGLMQQIAARRAAEQQANQAALNQILGQTGMARIQAQQQAAQDQAKLRLQMAELGIKV